MYINLDRTSSFLSFSFVSSVFLLNASSPTRASSCRSLSRRSAGPSPNKPRYSYLLVFNKLIDMYLCMNVLGFLFIYIVPFNNLSFYTIIANLISFVQKIIIRSTHFPLHYFISKISVYVMLLIVQKLHLAIITSKSGSTE